MQIELTIRANSLDEIAHIFAGPARVSPTLIDKTADVEAEPETAPTPKPTRGRRGAAKQDTPSPSDDAKSSESGGTTETSTTATTDASPSDEPTVTLEDVRNKASAIMDAGKASGADIQNMLMGKFNARAFGQLKAEQYADVLGELENL